MKARYFLFLAFTISLSVFSQNQFETTPPGVYTSSNAVSGWTIESGTNSIPSYACGGSVSWSPGSTQFSIMATPIFSVPISGPFSINNVLILNSPLGGNNVARLQDANPGASVTRIRSTFTVTPANCFIKIAWCGSWDGGGTNCCDRPSILVKMYNCLGTALPCYSLNLTPGAGAGCPGADSCFVTNGVSWTTWKIRTIDVTALIGNCMTLEIANSDNNGGAHHGSAYVDVDFGNAYTGISGSTQNPVGSPVNFCPGASVASMIGPIGNTSYSWTAPSGYPISPSQSTLSALTVTNPLGGNVYTLTTTTNSGCIITSSYTLTTSQVNIAAISAANSCSTGASGSASVIAFGSGGGAYSYTWTNSNNNVISSSSSANSLLPGTYTVQVSATGAAACGTAVSTVTIGVAPANYYTIIKPFCQATVVLIPASPGSNYQWYNNTTAITAIQGGTNSAYTVTNAISGGTYRLRFTTSQGCVDSVRFVLNQIPAGFLSVANSSVCPNQTNGSASVTISQSAFSPSQSSFSVFSVPLSYSSSVTSLPSFSYAATALGAGTYTVIASDGTCSYTTTFTVNDLQFNFSLLPSTTTLCAGNSVLASVNFTNVVSPGQYSYTWSPSVFLSSPNSGVTGITPTVATNSVTTIIYTVTVSPTILNCPKTNTMAVTAANVSAPTISTLQPFCNNASFRTATVSPTGGTFSSGGNWIGSTTGIISPTFCSVGINTFTYTSSLAGCTAAATGSFSVIQFNSAALTTTLLNICTANCMNLATLVQGSQFGIWTGPGVVSGTFCPTSPLGSSTLYYNTVSAPNPTMCPDSRTLSINYVTPVPPFITPLSPRCTTDPPFQVTVTPTTGSFTPSAWLNASGLFTPSLCTAGTYTVQYTNCNLPVTQQITIEAFIPSTLTSTVADQCSNNPAVNLSSIPLNNAGSWSGPGVTGTAFNPGTAGAGNFTLNYATASSPSGLCPSQSTLAITVYSAPVVNILGNSIICAGQTITLSVSGADTYSWSNNSASTVIIVTPTVSTSYMVTGTNTAGSCTNTKLISVTVNTVPIVTITGNLSICRGKTIPLTAGGANTYLWSNNSTNTVISVTPFSTTSYSLTGTSANCSATTIVTVNVVDCTGLTENSLDDGVKIYPNPTDGNLYFELKSATKIILYNELGQLLFESNLKVGNQSIDLGPFDAGVYLLRVMQDTKTSVVKVIRTK